MITYPFTAFPIRNHKHHTIQRRVNYEVENKFLNNKGTKGQKRSV